MGSLIRIHKNEKSSIHAVKQIERSNILNFLQESKGMGRSNRESATNKNSTVDHLAFHSGIEGQRYSLEDTHQNLGLEDDPSDSDESLTSDEKINEAAEILIMMSRDTRFSGLNSIAKNGSNGELEMRGVARYDIDNSDSKFFRKESCKKVEWKVPVNGSNSDGECKNSMKRQLHTSYIYGQRNQTNKDSDCHDFFERSYNKTHSHHIESRQKMANARELTHRSDENSKNTILNSIYMPDNKLIEFNSGKNKSSRDVSGNEGKNLGIKRTHKCRICSRVFKSSRGLDCHKGIHRVGRLEHKSVVRKKQVGLFDLNVPAPTEEEESGKRYSFH